MENLGMVGNAWKNKDLHKNGLQHRFSPILALSH
jgi:hypothetical protein